MNVLMDTQILILIWIQENKPALSPTARAVLSDHAPAQRSYNMSRVRSKDTKPELIVRKFPHSHGLRYKLLLGTLEVALPKHKTVNFGHDENRPLDAQRTNRGL